MNGGFQYTNNVLSFFPHAEGYVNVTLGKKGSLVFNYVYQYKDHLGNNRLSYTFLEEQIFVPGQPVELQILEENHYYPFGLKHTSYNTSQYEFVEVENGNDYYMNVSQLPAGGVSNYKYKYNGKEYQDELGLNMYDYHARNYDPALGRWMNIDPLADFVNYQSPYVVSDNNPVLYVDEYGLGIFRAIGNLFSRGAFAVKKLFSGKNCDCSQFQGESLVDAWNQPDFPALSNLFSGSGKKGSSNGSTTKEEPFQGERVTAVSIQAIEFSLPKISGIKTYATVEESIPQFRNRIINPKCQITFDEQIYFKTRSNEFLNEAITEKTLNDLIMTLKEYPQLKVHIEGNISFDSMSEASRVTIEELNHAKGFQLTRAQAVKKFLTSKGIDAKRISTGSGKVKFEGSKGRTTTFKLINN